MVSVASDDHVFWFQPDMAMMYFLTGTAHGPCSEPFGAYWSLKKQILFLKCGVIEVILIFLLVVLLEPWREGFCKTQVLETCSMPLLFFRAAIFSMYRRHSFWNWTKARSESTNCLNSTNFRLQNSIGIYSRNEWKYLSARYASTICVHSCKPFDNMQFAHQVRHRDTTPYLQYEEGAINPPVQPWFGHSLWWDGNLAHMIH